MKNLRVFLTVKIDFSLEYSETLVHDLTPDSGPPYAAYPGAAVIFSGDETLDGESGPFPSLDYSPG